MRYKHIESLGRCPPIQPGNQRPTLSSSLIVIRCDTNCRANSGLVINVYKRQSEDNGSWSCGGWRKHVVAVTESISTSGMSVFWEGLRLEMLQSLLNSPVSKGGVMN